MAQQEESEERSTKVSVFDLVAVTLDQFAAVAWQKLGLHPDPITREVDIDVAEARLAIDIASKMAEILESQLEEDDKRRVQTVLSDLRINYVRISQKPQDA